MTDATDMRVTSHMTDTGKDHVTGCMTGRMTDRMTGRRNPDGRGKDRGIGRVRNLGKDFVTNRKTDVHEKGPRLNEKGNLVDTTSGTAPKPETVNPRAPGRVASARVLDQIRD